MVNIRHIVEDIPEIPNGIGKTPPILPKRQLKPGQTATIDPKKYSSNEKSRAGALLTGGGAGANINHLKYLLNKTQDPEKKAALQAKIDELTNDLANRKKEFDPIIDRILPIIKSKCSEFLPTIQANGLLYRGTRTVENKNRLAFRAHSREYRNPTHSNEAANSAFIEALDSLGLKATRANSVFAIGDDDTAGTFGLVYIFFPCNGCHVTWSETTRDLIISPEDLYREVGKDNVDSDLKQLQELIVDKAKLLHDKAVTDGQPDDIVDYYTSVHTQISNIIDQSDSIRVAHLHHRGDGIGQIEPDLLSDLENLYNYMISGNERIQNVDFEIDLDKFQKQYQFKGDEEFNRAILSGHEILFTGEYICVASRFEDLLLEALGMKKENITEALSPGDMVNLGKFNPKVNKFEDLQNKLTDLKSDLKNYQK